MKPGKPLSLTVFLLTQFLLSSFLAAQQKTPAAAATAEKPAVDSRLLLREGWTLQTSAKVEAKGEGISTPARIGSRKEPMLRPLNMSSTVTASRGSPWVYRG